MKVIFAQGNPGSEYAGTRHNVGFMALDKLAGEYNVSFTPKAKFYADIAEIIIAGDKVLLAKPTTFYNETGRSARALVDFYKFDPKDDLLVVHDDLALPFGTIRIRSKGSDAGNNGIKSLNASIGADYSRIRIGIGTDLREQMNDADFVLGRFRTNEARTLKEEIIPKNIELLQDFLIGKLKETSYIITF